ncbi:MAG: hypothetical protein FJ125_15580, partial [Deltaproteobacteria bacterium]|nr:hypothetical protein [Deltaproteobacteria bacterium]
MPWLEPHNLLFLAPLLLGVVLMALPLFSGGGGSKEVEGAGKELEPGKELGFHKELAADKELGFDKVLPPGK